MMKTILLTAIVFFVAITAQAQQSFIKLSTSGSKLFFPVLDETTGGFILTHYQGDTAVISQVDSSYNQMWSKHFVVADFTEKYAVVDVKVISATKTLISGQYASATAITPFVTMLNENGDVLWTRSLPPTIASDAVVSSIQLTADSNIIVTCPYNGNTSILMLNQNGDLIKGIELEGLQSSYWGRIVSDQRGGYYLLTQPGDDPETQIFGYICVVHLDSALNTIWIRRHAHDTYNTFTIFDVKATVNGEIIAAGEIDRFVPNTLYEKYFGIMRFDTAGNIVAAKRYWNDSTLITEFSGVAEDASGNIIATGYSHSGLSPYTSMGIALRADAAGNFINAKSYDILEADRLVAALPKHDGFIITGSITNDDSSALCIIHTDLSLNNCLATDVQMQQGDIYMLTADTTFPVNSITQLDTFGFSLANAQYVKDTLCYVPPLPSYHPLLASVNVWHYTDNYFPVREQIPNNDSRTGDCQYPHYGFSTQQTADDTIINGLTYMQLTETNEYMTNTCLYGYVREDTSERKVYFISLTDSVENLLYNFSMQVGDSINISFKFETMYAYYKSGTYHLDSITTRNINAGERRVFHLNNHSPGNHHTLVWVESIGVLTDLIYTHTPNSNYGGMFANECNYAPHDYNLFLTCYSHAEPVYMDSCALNSAINNSCYAFENACRYYIICTGIKEIEALSNITLMPNPTEDYLNVSLDVREHSDFNLSILDVNGQAVTQTLQLQHVSTGIHNSTFSVAHLPAGIYLLQCKNDSGAVYRKFIKQ